MEAEAAARPPGPGEGTEPSRVGARTPLPCRAAGPSGKRGAPSSPPTSLPALGGSGRAAGPAAPAGRERRGQPRERRPRPRRHWLIQRRSSGAVRPARPAPAPPPRALPAGLRPRRPRAAGPGLPRRCPYRWAPRRPPPPSAAGPGQRPPARGPRRGAACGGGRARGAIFPRFPPRLPRALTSRLCN